MKKVSLPMSILQQLHHQIYGPSENFKGRIVFVHGLMGAGQNWRKIVHFFEGSYQCLVYDQRGHGRSFKPETGYAPADYAEDLRQLTMALGWSRFILVGHSMGGRTAFHFAFRHPEHVEKLVIEDIGPEQQDGAEKYYEELLGVVPDVFSSREEAKKFFNTDFLQKAKTRENVQVIAQFFYTNIIDLEDGRASFRFRKQNIIDTVKLGRSASLWSEIQQLQMPTLWVRGERSAELTQPNYEKILSLNSKIYGTVIPEAGHWIHVEQPARFCTELQAFIEEVKF